MTTLQQRPVADRHLDLGCGTLPRNPYGRQALFGVDIRRLEASASASFEFAAANLSFEPIPFADGQFASVSAFDFLEHIPRVLNGREPNTTVFPFVRLMNEVWRVLAPGGLFYALTPCYPGREAFTDPTHVNIITERTHEYFIGDEPPGRMYGFEGCFALRRAQWVIPEHSRTVAPPTLKQSWDRWRREKRGKLVYFLWELEALKPASR
ncbi:MAG: methyltransferase domain-containing protein [Burkholderiales bacterium]